MTMILDGSNGVTFNDASLQGAAASPYVLKNRIINGAMVIDQRYAGAATANTINGYVVDRFQVNQLGGAANKVIAQQNAGSVTPPVGFTNYLGVTSQSAYSVSAGDIYVIQHVIEGFNTADLGWGTANAKTITLSFQVRSSLTGTFGGSLRNDAGNRCYPFTYSIPTANTWTTISITVAGDTTGTWTTNNSAGIILSIGLGVGTTYSGTAGAWAGGIYFSATGATSVVGTNGATFYITGVQLEQNTSATPFERRLYNQELANCYRYYYRYKATGSGDFFGVGQCFSSTQAVIATQFPVVMRSSPSVLEQSGTASDYRTTNSTSTLVACSSVPTFNSCSAIQATTVVTVASGLTAGNSTLTAANTGTNGYLGWSAEL
jgi:hypothetical protein